MALGAGRVDLHTGDYCAVRADRKEDGFEQLTHAADEAIALGLDVADRHGLGYDNVEAVVLFAESRS